MLIVGIMIQLIFRSHQTYQSLLNAVQTMIVFLVFLDHVLALVQ